MKWELPFEERTQNVTTGLGGKKPGLEIIATVLILKETVFS